MTRAWAKALPTDVDRGRWIAVGVGLALAALAWALPFVPFALRTLITIAHELGHTAARWLFGYPAVPAFDLEHGGGVTRGTGRAFPLLCVAWAAMGWAAWRVRGHPVLCALVVGAWGAHATLYLTGGDEPLIVAMGHGAELLLVGVFLDRGVAGRAVSTPMERPLYVMVSVFAAADRMRFFGGLATDPGARQRYIESEKGVMDLVKLAFAHFGTSVAAVAWAFLGLTALAVVAGFAFPWVEGPIRRALAWRAGDGSDGAGA